MKKPWDIEFEGLGCIFVVIVVALGVVPAAFLFNPLLGLVALAVAIFLIWMLAS